jgi:hypothetical protein
VLSTSHLRELTAAATRVFGWDNQHKTPGDTYNTLMITQEQLKQIRMLREGAETPEKDREEISRRLTTPEGQNGLRRMGRELSERAQQTEQPKLPPAPPGPPETYKVTIRGDGGGVKTKP